jgi:hypothetical protein
MLDRITPNDRAVIGNNQPPSAIELAKPTFETLGQFLKDNPVIANDGESREAKVILDRTILALKGIEDERKAKVAPLNAELIAINGEYHRWHSANGKPGTWDTLLKELRIRLTAFAQAEETKRQAAAEAARAVTEHANEAFAQFKTADRIAQRTERDTTVRIGGGFGRVSTLRTAEILIITDWRAAIEDIGLTQDIADAILKGARAYRKENGELPNGISRETERRI